MSTTAVRSAPTASTAARTQPSSRSRPRRLALALLPILFAACAGSPPDEVAAGHVDRLLGAIAARLELAGKLADARWNARLGVDEPMRERESVEAGVSRSFTHALPPEVVQDVLQAQVDAGKIAQESLRARWNTEGRTPVPPSAEATEQVWREIGQNTPRLLEELSRAYPVLRKEGGRALLEERAKSAFSSTPGGTRAATTAVAPLWQLAQ